MGARKGFKVTDADRKTRVGIAVETFDDLKRKTVEKFKLDLTESQVFFQTRDGFPVRTAKDFAELEPQTLLIWTRKGERAETDAEILYRTIREVNLDFLTTGEKVQEFFTENMKSKVYRLAEVLKGLEDDKARLNTKEDDPEWFKGIDSCSKTKEEYMFRRSQDRIRTYYYKTKDELLKKPSLPEEQLHRLLQDLQRLLKETQYFGCYFDRRPNKYDNLCDELGTFKCQGRWDKENCLYIDKHTINPYRSREARIIFQTWNLDHRIERSRMIIPNICKALELESDDGGKALCVDARLIFNDLFSLNNLKFVHIVCHDKGAHKEINSDRYVKYLY